MNASDGNNNNPHENNRSRFNDNQRKGKGRQKLNMEKIENETNLQVTFSKRRAGLFKKASELSTLCGAENAIVVFSPGDKAHSFGHPNVETIASRFLNTHLDPPDTNPLLAAHNEATMRQRNQELISLEAQLEAERQRKRELESLLPPNISELNYDQLAQLQASLLDFKKSFEAKVKSASSGSGGPGVGFVNDPSGLLNVSNPWGGNPYDPNLANLGYTVQYPDQFVGGIVDGGGGGGGYMNYPMNPYNYGNPSDEVSSDSDGDDDEYDEDETQD